MSSDHLEPLLGEQIDYYRAIAAARVGDARVHFIQADLFSWRPDRRYDVVCIGFWLSHVPLERFEAFWSLVDDCLGPDGRVMFVDGQGPPHGAGAAGAARAARLADRRHEDGRAVLLGGWPQPRPCSR